MGSPAPPAFAILDPTSFQKYLLFGNGDGGGARDEFAWAKQNIPFFESSDEDFTTAYYFRWHMMHTHMNATGWTGKDKISKWLITEFTNVIGTHSGAAGHHLMEIRWLRDPVVWKDYIEYWANGANHPYTAWYSAAFFEAYKTLAEGGARTTAGPWHRPKPHRWCLTLLHQARLRIFEPSAQAASQSSFRASPSASEGGNEQREVRHLVQ